MSIRYYLSDVIGDGTEDNPYRPALSDVPSEPGEARSFEVNTTTGQALVVTNRVNHALLIADSRTDALPDSPLDIKLNAVRTETVNAIETRIAARGFTKTWSNSDAFRDMLRAVGKEINPNFNEDNFGPN